MGRTRVGCGLGCIGCSTGCLVLLAVPAALIVLALTLFT
jgi:hypothetical protein